MSTQKKIAHLVPHVDWTLPTEFIAELLQISYGTAYSMKMTRLPKSESTKGKCQQCHSSVPNGGVMCIPCLRRLREKNRQRVAGKEESCTNEQPEIKLHANAKKRYERLRREKELGLIPR